LQSEIERIINDDYLPTSLPLDYSIYKENKDSPLSIVIYSHGLIDNVQDIQEIAEELGIEYKDVTVDELADTIDSINFVLKNQLLEPDFFSNKFNSKTISNLSNGHTKITWQRYAEFYQKKKG